MSGNDAMNEDIINTTNKETLDNEPMIDLPPDPDVTDISSKQEGEPYSSEEAKHLDQLSNVMKNRMTRIKKQLK